jgi:AraC-like DNA-binding protein
MSTAKRPRRTTKLPLVKDDFRYLVVGPRDRQWGLFVTSAGAQFIAPHARFRSVGHSPAHDYVWERGRVLQEYSITYLIRGEGEFESEHTAKRKIDAGDAILLFPGVWHRYRPVEEIGFDSYWVMFQGDQAERLFAEGFFTPREPVWNVGIDQLVLRPFLTLLDRIRSQPAGLQPLLASDTLAILAGIRSAAYRRNIQDHVHEMVRQAQLTMEAADVLPAIDDLAAKSGLSRTQFYEAFKNGTGVSPYQYHLQLRMSRARELLQGSDLPIKKIASLLGFSSVYQFSKIFKKKSGFSPSRYRRGEHVSGNHLTK